MHEQSLVTSLLGQVAELALAHGACAVEEIRLRIGPLAGVEPLLLQSAFERLVARSSLSGARLVLVEVPLVATCRVCHVESPLESLDFRCAHCGSRDVQVIQGDGLVLESIQIREPAAAEVAT